MAIIQRFYGPSVDNWLLMDSPLYVMAILGFYLYFVLKQGPKLMENRPPFELKNVLMLYNFVHVCFSACLAIVMVLEENSFRALYHCTYLSQHQADKATFYTWLFFLSKIAELCDTVFFVLRKKQNQVTTLHLYHHLITVIVSWIYVKYATDGHGIYMGFVNCVVHTIMYSYYLISGLGPKYRKYLWWKKYVTWVQLIQFGIGLLYLAYIYGSCHLGTYLSIFYFANGILFIYLFGDFYLKAYNKQKNN